MNQTSDKGFRYTCSKCGEIHEGLPDFASPHPIEVLYIPENERTESVELSEDDCVIEGKHFYIRVRLEIPILETDQVFSYGIWVSVSQKSHQIFRQTFGQRKGREQTEPFFAWLTLPPPPYPQEEMLKSMIHLQPFPMRPLLELEPTDHPLSLDYYNGISREKAQAMAEQLLHSEP